MNALRHWQHRPDPCRQHEVGQGRRASAVRGAHVNRCARPRQRLPARGLRADHRRARRRTADLRLAQLEVPGERRQLCAGRGGCAQPSRRRSATTARSPSSSTSRPSGVASTAARQPARGIANDYIGQVSRDVVRLLRADANPGELIWEAVAYGAPRAEFGWGHSIASLTDCLTMTDRYEGDQRALPIVQAIAGVAESERDRPVQPLPDPARSCRPTRAASSAGWSRPSSSEPAQALLRGAIEPGYDRRRAAAVVHRRRQRSPAVVRPRRDLRPEGVPAARPAGVGAGRHRAAAPVPTFVYGTREDKLPYMRLFHRGLAAARPSTQLAEAAAEPDPRLGRRRPAAGRAARRRPHRGGAGGRRGAACRSGARPACSTPWSTAVSERMLRYDIAGERDFHDDFGWLDITHGLTYANAARWHVGARDAAAADLLDVDAAGAVDRVPRQLDRPPRVAHRGRRAGTRSSRGRRPAWPTARRCRTRHCSTGRRRSSSMPTR